MPDQLAAHINWHHEEIARSFVLQLKIRFKDYN